MLRDGLRLALTLLTVAPVRGPRQVDRRRAGVAMLAAPAVGLGLGLVARLADSLLPGLLGPVGAVVLLAALTRGLHLDGLADLADGLGSRRAPAEALEVMRRGDVGPFGVLALVLVLLVDVAALGSAHPAALVAAGLSSRAVLPLACARGIPAARAQGLGALVAGSVPRWAAAGAAAAAVATAGALGGGLPAAAAAAAGLLAGMALVGHAARRLGGVSGDVLGAAVEVAAAATLVAAALLR